MACGSAAEVGRQIGARIGPRLEGNIRRYIARRSTGHDAIDESRLRRDAGSYFDSLPRRFRHELEGMSQGSGVGLDLIRQMAFVEESMEPACTSLVYEADGDAWVARNNDMFAPEMWGWASQRSISDRIPTLTFSLEGDPFAPTGVNRERLWLHYNHATAPDSPSGRQPVMAPYVLLVELLETCGTLAEVEATLASVDRTSGMLLTAVDGKTNQHALFEVSASQVVSGSRAKGTQVTTNHYCSAKAAAMAGPAPAGSLRRQARAESIAGTLHAIERKDVPRALTSILADDEVEQRGDDFATAYSAVCCPAKGIIWYTFGGHPAASHGQWTEVEWPW